MLSPYEARKANVRFSFCSSHPLEVAQLFSGGTEGQVFSSHGTTWSGTGIYCGQVLPICITRIGCAGMVGNTLSSPLETHLLCQELLPALLSWGSNPPWEIKTLGRAGGEKNSY